MLNVMHHDYSHLNKLELFNVIHVTRPKNNGISCWTFCVADPMIDCPIDMTCTTDTIRNNDLQTPEPGEVSMRRYGKSICQRQKEINFLESKPL